MTGIYVVLFIVSLVILGLAYYVYKINNFFSKLSKVKDDSLGEVLRKIIKNQEASKKEFSEIYSEIARIDKEKGQSLQRVGFVRYKPFGERELGNSFAMALLDTHGTGVVINILQRDDKTRAYAKEISRGQAKLELSSEEKLAILRAMKI